MKRVITIEQRRGHEGVCRSTKGSKRQATCADCRCSDMKEVDGVWAFVCRLAKALTPKTCPDFRDAREPLCTNYLRTQ